MPFDVGKIFGGVAQGIDKRRENKTNMLKLSILNQLRRDQLDSQDRERAENRARLEYEDSPLFENDEQVNGLPEIFRPLAKGSRKKDRGSFLSALSSYSNAQTKAEATKTSKGNKDTEFTNEANAALAQMEGLLGKLPTGFLGGGLAKIGGMTGQGYADADTYDSFKSAIAVKIYRGVTKDTRLSDADAKARALPLLPNITDSASNRKAKLDFLHKLLNGEVPVPSEWTSTPDSPNTGAIQTASAEDPKAALLKRKAELEAKARGQ